jgi:hypothetical protein
MTTMTTRFATAAVHATTAVVVGGAVQRSTAQPAFALPRGALDDETVRLAAISRRAAELDLRGFAQRANVERQKFLRRQKDAADRRDRRSYDAAKRELEKYDAQMREKIEGILYPGLPAGARQSYITAHGCSAWTEPALRSIEAVSARGGVVELGAGSGHWARALRSRGLDVVAFDDMSALPTGVPPDPLLVRKGDETALSRDSSLHSRTLLLVFPDPGPMAKKTLAAFRGAVFVYVGEGRDGANADASFFDELEGSRWQLESTVPLNPFPGNHEKMYIFRRRSRFLFW